MGFDAHGSYDIKIRGEIFFVRFFQTWNQEGAKAFFESYKKVILEQNLERFGVLGDLRRFEGGHPDSMPVCTDIAQWCFDHGQVARAQLVDTSLIDYMMQQPTLGKELFPIRTFDKKDQALDWLTSLGLKTH